VIEGLKGGESLFRVELQEAGGQVKDIRVKERVVVVEVPQGVVLACLDQSPPR